jgi:hypothetical protein
MNPLFNSSGYLLDSQELRVLQKEGWISLPLTEIADLKTKSSFTGIVVRLSDGRKKSLDLSHLSTRAFSEVRDALRKAHHKHRLAAAGGKTKPEPNQSLQPTAPSGRG